LRHGLRTIVYAQSRKYTELISLWASQQAGRFSKKICAYRAGLLPEERRDVEQRLVDGDILAVVSTSALELGIDIGGLDLCILVGYPGSIMSTWQRGGRVGRNLQDSAIILVAQEDAMDQYFIRNPMDLITRLPESAVVNPHNPSIMEKHLKCAASELSLMSGEACINSEEAKVALHKMVKKGGMLLSADGSEYYSASRLPQREFNLRGIEKAFQIISKAEGKRVGEVDGFRAFRETHPGAVYLHMGKHYVVDELNLEQKTVHVRPLKVNYFTRVLGKKSTDIIETTGSRQVGRARVHKGRLRVTDQVTGFQRRSIRGQRLLNVENLDLPPQVFETEGLWIEIPIDIQKEVENARMHFMGGIHALEHAAIGILPLIVLADRNDLGGISTPFHPHVGSGAIFIYDAVPGGVGLCGEAYERAEEFLSDTLKVIHSCDCENGCPSCVHSPKCGSGNRPIDKEAALCIINSLMEKREKKHMIKKKKKIKTDAIKDIIEESQRESQNHPVKTLPSYGVMDIETQLSAQEVGGWHRADLMRVSCAVLYDSITENYEEFLEKDMDALMERLDSLDLIIGFNLKRFDYKVLSAYTSLDFWSLNTLDILEDVHKRLGYRLSLAHLANVTLGTSKSADGLQALRWWKEGKIKEIVEYCKKDVEITKDMFLYGYNKGHLLFKNKAGKVVRLQVDWGDKSLVNLVS
jgi:DEAD/DEAH box helicase domain-containing protein